MSQSSSYQTRALDRALNILEAFSINEPELTLSDLTERTGLAKTTTFRLLAILKDRGYVEQLPDSDRYRVGIRAFELGSVYIQTTTLAAEAKPFLRRLVDQSHNTSNLAVLDQGEIVHLAVVAPNRPIRFHDIVGGREQAHCSGLGKALLAGLSEAELDKFFAQRDLPRRTERTITDAAELRLELERVREQGFALDDEESYTGLRCIAAPVYDDKNHVAAAVSISAPSFELSDAQLPLLIDAVVATARDISKRLGNSVQSAPVMAARSGVSADGEHS